MKKFIIEAAIVFAIVFGVDFLLGTYLDKNHALDTCEVAKNAANNTVEVAMMGASEMGNQYNTPLIADSLGISAYNYGWGGVNIYFQYALLNLMLDNAPVKPKSIILEVQSLDFYDKSGYNTEKLSELNTVFNFDENVREVLELQDDNTVRWLKCSKLYKFNTKYIISCITPLYEKLYPNHHEPEMGYTSIDAGKIITTPLETDTTDNDYSFDAQKIECFRKLISLCKNNEISLILVNAPYYAIQPRVRWVEWLEEICKEENIPFLNYDKEKEIFLEHPDWYYNSVHFNTIGADYYSKMIIPDLRKYICQ